MSGADRSIGSGFVSITARLPYRNAPRTIVGGAGGASNPNSCYARLHPLDFAKDSSPFALMSYDNLTKILAEKYPERFATLTAQPTEELLMQVASEVGKMEPAAQRQELSSYVQIMAGLRFNKTLVKRLFREDIMKESVIYQEIFETGEQQGEQRALQREKALILRLISRQVGEVPQDLRSTVELLSIDRLEALGEALLDFSSLQDLQNWLGMN